MAITDPAELLDSYAAVCAEMGPRLAPIYQALRAAAPTDPTAAELWRRVEDERRFGSGRVAQAIDHLGGLRSGLDIDAAADVLWVLNDPGLHHLLVERRGWPSGKFADWLSGAMRQQLLAI